MAVVQLRAGIYVNSIEEVPAAEQTAAYKYASLFTKARKENWEMSQRQAASEIADAKVRDAAAIKSYDAQIADYGDRLKQLDQDIALTGRDVAKANAATQRTALQEATARQNNEILWEKAKVEGVVVSGASRSRSDSESKGGGGSGGGSTVRGLDKTGKDSGDDIRLKMSGALNGTANQIGAVENGLVQGAKTLDMSTEGSAIGNHALVIGDLVQKRKDEKINQGMTAEDALNTAETEILTETAASPYKQYGVDYEKAQEIRAKEAAAGGRTSKSGSSSSRDAATLQPRYPGLGTMPVADVVTAEIAPKVPLDTAALEKKRGELAGQLAALLNSGAPASQVDDFITRSREIMAGRFGRVAESPNFYQRNVAQAILRGDMTNEDIALLRSDYDNRGRPVRILPTPTVEGTSVSGAVPTTTGTPGRLVYDTSYGDTGGFGEAELLGSLKTSPTGATATAGTPGKLVYDTSYGDTGGFGEAEPLGSLKTSQTGARTSPVTPGATPTAAPIVTGGSAPAVSPDASGEAPATAASSAADTAAASGASPAAVGAAAGAAAAAVPTAANTVRAVENTRLNNFPNRMDELASLFPDGVPQEVLDAAANMQRSNPPPSVPRPQMQNPGGSTGKVGPFMPGFGDPTPDIGSKPEAVGDFNIPDVPSVYNDRPFDPVTNPYGGKFAPNKRVPLPPDGDQSYSNITYEPGDEVPISDFERQQIIKLMQKQREENQRKQDAIDDAADAKKKGKSGSTLEYFKGRFDSAKQIIDQPGKLARLTASGPGKVAADVYNANKTSGKDFKLTYETLTATYEDDKEALATAHQVALALDIASRARTAPPKA